jgi:acetyl-CoA acetyltransferase
MPGAVIVDAVRTPLGKRNGKLREWHPVDLAAVCLDALATRSAVDPAVVDDVVLGCVMQVGEQAINVARNAVLAAGWPESASAARANRPRTSQRKG